ncbi:MAG: signal peptidase II [Anaerolineae bacterium]
MSDNRSSLLGTGRRQTFLVALIVLILDQFSKWLVVSNIPVGVEWAPVSWLANSLVLTHTTNTGAAFGLAPDAGWIFVVIAVIVVLGIIFYYDKLPTDHWMVRVALGLLLGGSIGNLIDRLTRGSVVDFIDLRIWPIFNVADSAIVVGVFILFYYLLKEEKAIKRRAAAAAAQAETAPSTADADETHSQG